jgi:hypothetical protein
MTRMKASEPQMTPITQIKMPAELKPQAASLKPKECSRA